MEKSSTFLMFVTKELSIKDKNKTTRCVFLKQKITTTFLPLLLCYFFFLTFFINTYYTFVMFLQSHIYGVCSKDKRKIIKSLFMPLYYLYNFAP